MQHHNLRHESDGFKPQWETPEEGPGSPAGVKDAGEDESHGQESPVRELVAEGVICRAEWYLVAHKVNQETRWGDEENLHERVVDWHEVQEEIRVANQEDQQVDLLSLAREA